MIDPRAVIIARRRRSPRMSRSDPSASSAPEVMIGARTWIGPHAVINGPTRIGADNKIFQFASIGDAPQDKKYTRRADAARDRRPQRVPRIVTVNRGTAHGPGRDAHRQRQSVHGLLARRARLPLGDQIVMANCATLGGHVEIGDWVIMGGLSAVHQFTKIGAHAFLAHNAVVTRDVPPYVMAVGQPGRAAQRERRGPEAPRLQRRADPQHPARLPRAVPLGAASSHAALEQLERAGRAQAEIRPFVEFIKRSSRSIVR